MNIRNEIFDNYMDIRGTNIDSNSEQEQERFRHIVLSNYSKYIPQNSKILEIGCYKGYTLNEMKKFTNDESIFGIELAPSAVDFAKKYTQIPNIFNEDAFVFLPKYKNHFDVIIMKAVLEHIEKKKVHELLHQVNGSLKNGGIALISVPNMAWIMAGHERYMDFTHEVGFTIESLYDVSKLNFDEVDVKAMEYDFPLRLKDKIRKKFITPIVMKIVSFIYKALGQGAYVETMFDRSIIAVCRKR